MDPEQVRQGREQEMNDMGKTLGMFDCGSWEESTSKAGKDQTTVKNIDDGREIVRCRQVPRDFNPKRESPMDELFVAMPLGAKKALFAYVARGAREEGENRTRTK